MPLISTDAIRSQLFGDEAIQGPWLLVWREVQRQFQQAVAANSRAAARFAIYDATNAQRRHRSHCTCPCYWLYPHYWAVVRYSSLLCLARNRRRERLVPEDVILRMHRQPRCPLTSKRG